MITLTRSTLSRVLYQDWFETLSFDYIGQVITLSVITLKNSADNKLSFQHGPSGPLDYYTRL
jgi:hypothetical protein